MIELTLNVNDRRKLIGKLDAVSPQGRMSVTKKAWTVLTLKAEDALALNITNKILNVRTNRLRGSISSRVIQTKDNIEGIVGSGVRQGDRVPYANIHETGGTIRPKNSRWLTIPLKAAKTKGGDLRGISARDFPNTFVRIHSAERGTIYQRQGNAVVALFLLRKKAVIPARRYMSRTLEQIQPKVMEILMAEIEKELKR